MNVNKKLFHELKLVLENCADFSQIEVVQPVSGGDINQAAYVQTKENNYFIKWNKNVRDNFFAAEVDGLQRLKESGAVNVPQVYAWTEGKGEEPAFLVMEWIESSASKQGKDVQAKLGYQLAQMHQHTSALFGLDKDNYIGTLPQYNCLTEDWLDFYRFNRLQKQIELAARHGRMPTERANRLEKLLNQLEKWLGGRKVKPSLLHGDLWSGNWLVTQESMIVMIDPAVYYGDREVDIAYSQLFGGFHSSFYSAYEEAFPLEEGFEERKPLYHLYYLLAYLTIFGNCYGHDVDQIINRYIH